MSVEIRIVKLNSITRKTAGEPQPCFVLDSQQGSLSEVCRLALVPGVENKKPDGSKEITIPHGEVQLLRHSENGKFPICFNLQPNIGYLALGIVQKNTSDSTTQDQGCSVEDSKRDIQLALDWLAKRNDWVQTKATLIYA